MQSYPWWSEGQKKFAEEIGFFAQEVWARDVETRHTREFPWDNPCHPMEYYQWFPSWVDNDRKF